jgi:nitrite reductase (NO-forming)
MSTTPTAPGSTSPGPLGGVAAGIALVLLAVLVGVIGQRAAGPGVDLPAAAGTEVAATGNTTTVEVISDGMRFYPDQVEVPAGDRLIIELANHDERRHDLVLANGARTPSVPPGETARLDAGVITGPLDGWCSLPGHRAAGMVFSVTTTDDGVLDNGAVTGGGGAVAGDDGSSTGTGHHRQGEPAPHERPRVDAMADPGDAFEARDAVLPPPAEGNVHRITLRVQEVVHEVAPRVRQEMWTFNGTAPGPVLRGRVGDIFEVTLINDGTLDHGIDFHAGALAPDRPMRPIEPGEELVYRFTATKAGVWMYHCSTHPMLHHIGNGMYGAVIIDPPDLSPVDREYVVVQSELYLGPDGEPGDLAKMQAETPDAVVFNGYVSQYAHRPLVAAAGERVRIWLLNAGPSRAGSFHVVGTQFDTVYREGAVVLHPEDPGGAQVLDLPPAAGGYVETVFPEPGTYPFVSHSMVDAERGARGAFRVTE